MANEANEGNESKGSRPIGAGKIVTADQKNDKTWKNVNKAKEIVKKTKQERK